MAIKIVFVTGGAKSGKSSFALNEVSGIEGKKAFIATAEALDEEMEKRIQRHKVERGNEWDTHEEPLEVSRVIGDLQGKYSAVILDCLTLWLSNAMIRTERVEERVRELIKALKQMKDSHGSGQSVLYIISNEVGMGIVPENPMAREFRDLAGGLNQKIAKIADEAYLVVAGIPIKIK